MDYSKMRELVENYFLNIRERNRILMQFEDPTHNVKAPKGNVYVSMNNSKTEREAIRKIYRDKRVNSVTQKINYVDLNLDVLTDIERKIINYIKYGDKISSIARVIGIERRKVARIRDTAINKMVNKINEQ